MEKFTCACLVVIIIAIQHLLNWMIRDSINRKGNDTAPTIVGCGILIFISILCFRYLILWGQLFVKN